MGRFFIEIAFDGSRYHGWQIQKNAISVQQVLDETLSTIFRQPVATVGCGRTDTGVHALQLFAHFELPILPISSDLDQVLYRINALLPKDIAARKLFSIHADAHARFDAIKRSYEYHAHVGKDPFLENYSWQLREMPDVAAMNEAAGLLKQYEDFSCFSKSHTQVFTNNCRITNATWHPLTEKRLVFRISADRFLRNMVRAIVGTLLEIGVGRQPVTHIHDVIRSKDRSQAGASVPAKGLFLTQVEYPYIS